MKTKTINFTIAVILSLSLLSACTSPTETAKPRKDASQTKSDTKANEVVSLTEGREFESSDDLVEFLLRLKFLAPIEEGTQWKYTLITEQGKETVENLLNSRLYIEEIDKGGIKGKKWGFTSDVNRRFESKNEEFEKDYYYHSFIQWALYQFHLQEKVPIVFKNSETIKVGAVEWKDSLKFQMKLPENNSLQVSSITFWLKEKIGVVKSKMLADSPYGKTTSLLELKEFNKNITPEQYEKEINKQIEKLKKESPIPSKLVEREPEGVKVNKPSTPDEKSEREKLAKAFYCLAEKTGDKQYEGLGNAVMLLGIDEAKKRTTEEAIQQALACK